MQITYSSPGEYKTERKSALLINIMYFMALTIGALALFGHYEYTNAMGYLERLHCDYIFSESHFTDIERKDYPRCEKRWDQIVKNITRNHP